MTSIAAMLGEKILGPCSCHEGYRSRGLIDPNCAWHDYSDDLIAVLAAKEKEIEGLREALARLEGANEALCAGRSLRTYNALLADGRADQLLFLDDARKAARAALDQGKDPT